MGDDDSTSDGPSRWSGRLNCWEVMRCAREPGGDRVGVDGVCPAAVESRLDGVLGGINAGRCCWIVAGTYCRGQRVSGTFAKRFESCRACPFFLTVQREEYPILWHASALVTYLSAAEELVRDHDAAVLGTFIDPVVGRQALVDLESLRDGRATHITAFFSDLTGFSAVGAALDPPELATFLNEYLSEMTGILREEGGTLDKYIGDAVVGIFGAPAALENDALAASRAALRMQRRLIELKAQWRAERRWCPAAWTLRLRIGLGTGFATVGLMGTRHLATYTMSGGVVNLAKWLERSCKRYGVAILVSGATRDLIVNEQVVRRIASCRPKGEAQCQSIYELIGPQGLVPPERLRAAAIYEAALALQDCDRWEEAAALLRTIADRDAATTRLLRHCQQRGSNRGLRGAPSSRKRPASGEHPH